MKRRAKTKQNEKVALRFKEVREKYFHNEIKRDKSRKNNTKQDFADFLSVSEQMIYNYETGRNPIPTEILMKLANEYGICLDYLLGNSDYITLEEKQKAINAEQYEKRIKIPHEIDNLIGKIMDLYGYEEVWDELTEKEYFTSKYLIPDGYDRDCQIPQDALVESFKKTGCAHHPHYYRAIVRKKDGKKSIHPR